MPKYTKKEASKQTCSSKVGETLPDLTFHGCCMGCTKKTKGTQMFIDNKLSCKCLNETKFCKDCLEKWLNKESNKRQCPICKVNGITEIKCLQTNKKFKILKPKVEPWLEDEGFIFEVIRHLTSGNIRFRNTRQNYRVIVGNIGNVHRRRIVLDILNMIDDDSNSMDVHYHNNRALVSVVRRRLFR